MMPTGSCPTTSPGAPGYSPFKMCGSVPQLVVVVIRMSASLGPMSGTFLSWSSMRLGLTNTAAFIVPAMTNLPGRDVPREPAHGRAVNRFSRAPREPADDELLDLHHEVERDGGRDDPCPGIRRERPRVEQHLHERHVGEEDLEDEHRADPDP